MCWGRGGGWIQPKQWLDAAIDITLHAIEAGWLRFIICKIEVKKTVEIYIYLCNHQNSATDIVADTF